MKKLFDKQKHWQINKINKELLRRTKKNKGIRKRNTNQLNSSSHSQINHAKIKHSHTVRLTAPTILSVFQDPTETLRFFNTVRDKVKTATVNTELFFDLSNIKIVPIDSVMYLIAIIRNTKKIKSLHIQCLGNMPADPKARHVIESSGFYRYVSPLYKYNKQKIHDSINITQGIDADSVLAASICDFVHFHSTLGIKETRPLYKMILELMANTKQHAYNQNNVMDRNWYVYVEDNNDYLSFIFLDTGLGIPNTIKTKNIFEKIKETFDLDDAFFIASAFDVSQMRSETKLSYRGKGLPEIYKRIKESYIEDFSVVSGKGKCDFSNNGVITKTNMNNSIEGTMLCWKLNK